MNEKAVLWALARDVTGPRKAVLVAIAALSSGLAECSADQDSIAFAAGITVRCLRYSIRDLEEGGYLRCDYKARGRVNLYRIVFE